MEYVLRELTVIRRYSADVRSVVLRSTRENSTKVRRSTYYGDIVDMYRNLAIEDC